MAGPGGGAGVGAVGELMPDSFLAKLRKPVRIADSLGFWWWGLVDANGAIVDTQICAEVGLGEFELAVTSGNNEVAVD